ncbi:MAG: hypothetical protein JNK04_01590, partial [Myxococcales bacterium]|nr:hypothetical protein [Myxococcales bacterium]
MLLALLTILLGCPSRPPEHPQAQTRTRVVVVVLDDLPPGLMNRYLMLPISRVPETALSSWLQTDSAPGEQLLAQAMGLQVLLPYPPHPSLSTGSLLAGTTIRTLPSKTQPRLDGMKTLHARIRREKLTTMDVGSGVGELGATSSFESNSSGWEGALAAMQANGPPDLLTIRMRTLSSATTEGERLQALSKIDHQLGQIRKSAPALFEAGTVVFIVSASVPESPVFHEVVDVPALVSLAPALRGVAVDLLDEVALVHGAVEAESFRGLADQVITRTRDGLQTYDWDLREVRAYLPREVPPAIARRVADLASPGDTILVAPSEGCVPGAQGKCARFAPTEARAQQWRPSRALVAPVYTTLGALPSSDEPIDIERISDRVVQLFAGIAENPADVAVQDYAGKSELATACKKGPKGEDCARAIARIPGRNNARVFLAELGGVSATRCEANHGILLLTSSASVLKAANTAAGAMATDPDLVRSRPKVVTCALAPAGGLSGDDTLALNALAAGAAVVVRASPQHSDRVEILAQTHYLRGWLGPAFLVETLSADDPQLASRIRSQWHLSAAVEGVLRSLGPVADHLAAVRPTSETTSAWRDLFLYWSGHREETAASAEALARLTASTAEATRVPRTLLPIVQRLTYAKGPRIEWSEASGDLGAFMRDAKDAIDARADCNTDGAVARSRIDDAVVRLADRGNVGLALWGSAHAVALLRDVTPAEAQFTVARVMALLREPAAGWLRVDVAGQLLLMASLNREVFGFGRTLEELQDASIAPVLRQLLREADPGERADALQYLAVITPAPDAIPAELLVSLATRDDVAQRT